jgi:thymidylate kinase
VTAAPGEHPGVGPDVLVAEVLGPPGAGKTTILEALSSRLPATITPVRAYRSRRLLPAYARAGVAVAPMVWSGARGAVDPWKHVNWMIRMQASTRVLTAQRPASGGVVLFDQGPAYTLVRLRRPVDETTAYERWWRQMAERWARLLDVVIFLDAADEVLLERIRGRTKAHAVKDIPAARADRILTDYRRQCEDVAGALAASGQGARVHRLDTSSGQLPHHIDAVLDALWPGRTQATSP